MIPTVSIVSMFVSGLLASALPVVLFLAFRKRYGLKSAPMLVGVATFIIFAMILEQTAHYFILRPDAEGNIALMTENFALFTLYGAFAAGIFEESGRFAAFKLLKKKFAGPETGFAYGIGHGGIEAVMVCGLSFISSAVIAVMVNRGVAGLMPDAALETLSNTAPSMFIVGFVERVFAMIIHISLSMVVWRAVNKKGNIWLFPAAIILHAAIDIFPALYQAGAVTSIALVEVMVGGFSLAVAGFAFWLFRKDARQGREALTTGDE